MKIYLDNCCFNRPYDAQRQIKIRLETQAKLALQELVRSGEIELVWSFMLDFENKRNLNTVKQHEIARWAEHSVEYQLGDSNLLDLAEKFVALGLKKNDAVHLACAIQSRCDYFITTDKRILAKSSKITEIKVINPTDYFIKPEENP